MTPEQLDEITKRAYDLAYWPHGRPMRTTDFRTALDDVEKLLKEIEDLKGKEHAKDQNVQKP